jgi:ankyrin repeat protein
MLLEMGADVNKVDIDGYTPLLSACLNDMPNVVKMLLEAGADVDTVDDLGRVPFTVACERGHEEVVEVLFDHYMQVNE